MSVSLQAGSQVVNQACDIVGGACWPPQTSSFNSLSGGLANVPGLAALSGVVDLQNLTPARGRLGIEEIPFQGQDPVPQVVVPPPAGGWGAQAAREDALQRFENRSTNGIDGGGRSTNITRFTPQLIQYQQNDDSARHRMFERNVPSQVKTTQRVFV